MYIEMHCSHLTELLSDIILLSGHDVLHLPQPQDVPGVHHQAGRQRQHHRQQLGHDEIRAWLSRVNWSSVKKQLILQLAPPIERPVTLQCYPIKPALLTRTMSLEPT